MKTPEYEKRYESIQSRSETNSRKDQYAHNNQIMGSQEQRENPKRSKGKSNLSHTRDLQ